MPALIAVEGDITAQRVDAVVNAANSAMRGGGGVDGAIHRAGGPSVLEDCIARFPHGLATGDAGWTSGGCDRRSLEVADELGARTVAFPLISAGIYGWPREDAIHAAVDTIREADSAVEEARLVALGTTAYREIVAVIGEGR